MRVIIRTYHLYPDDLKNSSENENPIIFNKWFTSSIQSKYILKRNQIIMLKETPRQKRNNIATRNNNSLFI